jgi:pyruvate dehydrogenase E1 component beta subunit
VLDAETGPERVGRNLNRALHRLLDEDPRLHVLGEDIVDPYGGAFGVTQGLSTRYPDRVRPTPLSEGAIVGVAAGMALAGDRVIVEIMFGDFAALAFDQLVNFASKSVSMYGRRVPVPLLVRCPTGGRRGYGPTHSQSLQKHFLGVPNLAIHELSPYHDCHDVLRAALDRAEPAMIFEDKLLYTRPMYVEGVVDDLFRYDFPVPGVARSFVDGGGDGSMDGGDPECVVIAPGGMAHRALAAARSMLLEDEITCQVLVPSQLYPFDVAPLVPRLRSARTICVAEDGTPGGSWGSEVATRIHEHLPGMPVRLVAAEDAVVPTAAHLERHVLVDESTIVEALR